MEKTIMAIGGHIGDMELTAGGVLASMALDGAQILTVALTAGERGNPPHITPAVYREQKIKEAEAFASLMNNGKAIVFPCVDGELPDSEDIAWQLCDLIRQYKPNVLITHWKNSIHKDHEVTSRIVKKAQFYAGLASIERTLPAHYAAGPYYAENWEDPDGFAPYTYVAVSEEGFALWQKAIENHCWFAMHSSSFAYFRYYSHLKAVRGCLCRKSYAEAYAIDEEKKKVTLQSL